MQNSDSFNYDQLFNDFKIDVPKYFNFAFDVMDKRAVTDRNKLAMIWVDENKVEQKLSYRDFKIKSNQVANFLKKYEISRGDNVLLMLHRVPEWWYFILGLMKVQAVFAPCAVSLTAKDLAYRCEKAKIKMIVTDLENTNKFDSIKNQIPTVESFVCIDGNKDGWIELKAELDNLSTDFINLNPSHKTRSDDPMLIYFTSGTTGYPKMVQHTHSYALAHRVTGELWHQLNPSSIDWAITDTGWAKSAWGSLFGQWLAGSTIFIYNYTGRFDAQAILHLLEKYGVTNFCAPPTAYRMLILEDLKKFNLKELTHCVSAGEPLNPEVIQIWQQGTGLNIYEGYGQTETVCIIATLPGMILKEGAIGKPLPPYEIAVLNEDRQPAKENEEGDVAIKVKPNHPVGVFKGYIGDEETNKKVFVGDWYLTGDKAFKDSDGYFWFVGRNDDVIKSSGYRIGPFEVESALIEHPAVIEAAVIGIPDEVRGQAIKAFVILASSYQPSDNLVKELQDHVRSVTAPFKVPRYIDFVKELPKTISGKIRRVELRENEKKIV